MLTTPIQIRFLDIDSLGHLNNAVFLTYLEIARLDFLASRLDIHKVEDIPFLLAHAEIDFKLPVRLQDSLEVRLWVGRIGNKSWDFAYDLRNGRGETVAVARTTQVVYDHAEGRTLPIDKQLRSVLEAENLKDGI